MPYKALLIGCGNIGAGYDFENHSVLTHAKAFSLDNDFSFDVCDRDAALAQKVAAKYKVKAAAELSDEYLKGFDIVSICTPTTTHFPYLQQLINLNTKLIICEKPVSVNQAELTEIEKIYKKGNSKVLVNYIRRFQPAFINLKEEIKQVLQTQALTNINIRYQRGFINNASHAFDLIEFITGDSIQLSNTKIHNKVLDAFETDPTLTLTANWNDTNFAVTGLSNVKFSFFEIDLFFEYTRISIKDAGNTIEIYTAEKGEVFFKPLQKQTTYTECTKDYMKHVMAAAKNMLEGRQEDNFMAGVNLASKMLNYLQ